MANLVIDIGNTLTKLAVFEQDELLFAEHYIAADEAVLPLIKKYNVQRAIISAVKQLPAWAEALPVHLSVTKFNYGMAKGVINHYATPQTLGADRIAAVNGAVKLYPGQSSLVIDGGTAITYDAVDAGGNYFGGSISPGLNTRYKALNYFTGALPLLEPETDFDRAYGDSTITAIRSGVQNGIKYELKGFIENYWETGAQLNILLTGGDSNFFDTLLKNSIFAPCIKIEPHLVLIGLNAALLQHTE